MIDDDDDDEYDKFYGAIAQLMPLYGRLDKDNDTRAVPEFFGGRG